MKTRRAQMPSWGLALCAALVLSALIAGTAAARVPKSSAPLIQETTCDQHPTLRDDRCESWLAHYDNPGSHDPDFHLREHPTAATIDPHSDRIFVTGMSFDQASESADFATVAFSSRGEQLWVQRLSGPVGTLDHPTALALSEDGSVLYVTGVTGAGGDGTWRPITLAYRATDGAELWRAVDPVLEKRGFDPTLIDVSNRSVFVAGSVKDDSGGHDVLVVSYDLQGREISSSRFSTAGDSSDRPTAIAVSHDGSRVGLGGSSESTVDGVQVSDGFALVLEAANGSIKWQRAGAIDLGLTRVTDLALKVRGSMLHVVGTEPAPDDWEVKTVALRVKDGVPAWGTRFPLALLDLEPARLDPHVEILGNRVLVSATGRDDEGNFFFATAAFDDLSGQRSWTSEPIWGQATSMNVLSSSRDRPSRLVIGGRFRPEATPLLQPNGRLDCVTAALDPAGGEVAWIARFESEAAIRGSNCSSGYEGPTIVVAGEAGAYLIGERQHGNVDGITPPHESNTFDYMVLGYRWN